MYMTRFFDLRGGAGAVGILALRVVVGAAFVLHGWDKIRSDGGMFGWMGKALPPFWQGLAAFAEFGGGLGLLVGLLTPIASFGIVCTMAVAIVKVMLPKGAHFVGHEGPTYELCAVYLAAALAIMLAGPRALSLDALIFGRRSTLPK